MLTVYGGEVQGSRLPDILIFSLFLSCLEAELMAKREAPATEATALEALLRGDGILDKRNNNSKEEETLLEIQVTY